MNIRDEVLRRFLRYVKIDTQSQEGVEDRYPSTEKQLDLLRLLTQELTDLGLEEVELTEYGTVMATLPQIIPEGSQQADRIPTVGLLAHVDTYHELSGKDVQPILHENYAGQVIKLPKNEQLLDPKEHPELLEHNRDTLITSDGSTLLGADDKAGIAEIMTLLAWYQNDKSRPHPRLRIGFTPDEEVGMGTKYFDVKRFAADVAYTQDGSGIGEVEDETFCADTALVRFTGKDVHPGYAKNKMVNAARFAAEFISRFDSQALPETTEGREDYLHPYQVQASVSQATITILVRSFSEQGLQKLESRLQDIKEEVMQLEPRCKIEIEIKESYRNMKQVLDQYPQVVEYAELAMKKKNIQPKRSSIRGGTDGARLSFIGLPTPNLSAGGYNFHSLTEWVPLGAMVTAVEVLDALMQIYVERGLPKQAGESL